MYFVYILLSVQNHKTYTGSTDKLPGTRLCEHNAGSNDWTLTGFSASSTLSTYDWMLDTPTENYAMLNPLDKNASAVVSDGNLNTTGTNAAWVIRSSMGVSSGKWYWEVSPTGATSNYWIGIANTSASLSTQPATDANQWAYYSGNGNKYNGDNPGVAYGATYSSADVIGVALDMVQRIESHMIMRQYSGFLSGGTRIRGRMG